MTDQRVLNADAVDTSIIGRDDSAKLNSIEAYSKVDVTSFVRNNCQKMLKYAGADPMITPKRPRGRPRKSIDEEESKRKRAAYQAAYRAKNAEKIAGYRQAAATKKSIERLMTQIPTEMNIKEDNRLKNKASSSSGDSGHIHDHHHAPLRHDGGRAINETRLQSLIDVAVNFDSLGTMEQDDVFSRSALDLDNRVDCSEILYGGDIQLNIIRFHRPSVTYRHKVINAFVATAYDDENKVCSTENASCVDIQLLSEDIPASKNLEKVLKKVPTDLLRDTYILKENLKRTGEILNVRAIINDSDVKGSSPIVCATEKYAGKYVVCFEQDIKAVVDRSSFTTINFAGMILNHAYYRETITDMKMEVIAFNTEGSRYVKFEYLMFHGGSRYPVLKNCFIKVDPPAFAKIHHIPEFFKLLEAKQLERKCCTHYYLNNERGHVHKLWESEFGDWLESN